MVKSGYCTLHRRSFLKDRLFSIFLPVFTVDKVCHVSNKFRSPRNIRTQYFQIRDFIIHLHLENSLKIHLSFFFPKAIRPVCHRGYQKHPYFIICLLVLTVCRCTIFQIKTNFLTGQSNIYCLHNRPYIPPSFSKKINALHDRGSQKHSLFNSFLLVLRMSQTFKFTNKYQFSNQPAKNLYFHPRDLISPPFRKAIGGFHQKRVQDPVEHLRWFFWRKQLTAKSV